MRPAVVAWSAMWLLTAAAGCSPQPAAHAAPTPDVAASTIARAPAPGSTPPVLPVTTPLLRSADGAAGPPAPVDANGHGSPPVRIRIPAIGVDSSITSLGLAPDGTIQVPSDARQAGWYTRGPAPGDAGPAVIVGHLDSTIGPAVFAQLSRLRSGDQVLVARANGIEVRFTVERVATFSVDSFPTEAVYGAVPDPVLRLITCGGTFNRSQGRYLSNVVVFAVEAS